MCKQKDLLFLLIFMIMMPLAACSDAITTATEIPVDQVGTPIILPTDLDGLIAILQGKNDEARIQAARALANMGSEAISAVPALTQNLYYGTAEVRRVAADALGRLGPTARSSVPTLMVTLLGDSFVHARGAAAEALGNIGETIAVPALAAALVDESDSVQIEAAISLGLLTGEVFPDIDSQGGYSLNQEGVPIIVEAAREWWENEGRNQYWQ